VCSSDLSIAVNEQDVIDRFDQWARSYTVTEQNVVDIVASGELGEWFEINSQPVSVAIGGQYRDQQLKILPDTLRSSSEGNEPGFQFPVEANASVWAVFGEMILPPLMNGLVDKSTTKTWRLTFF